MDGFKLLEVVGLELDLPVIMMSSHGGTAAVLRGVTHGAVDYLIKPVRLEELRNLWQHVVRRAREGGAGGGGVGGSGVGVVGGVAGEPQQQLLQQQQQQQQQEEEQQQQQQHPPSAATAAAAAAAGEEGSVRKRKGLDDDEGDAGGGDAGGSGGSGSGSGDGGGENNSNSNKKQRVVWTIEMHRQFVEAVTAIGIERAVPKRILEMMTVDGLSRENVASHLQKYRL